MSLTENVKEIIKEESGKQREVRLLLDTIKKLATVEFATDCENRLTNTKHAYSINGYISQLKKIIHLLNAGAKPGETLEIVDSCIDIDLYIQEMYGKEQGNV